MVNVVGFYSSQTLGGV